MTTKNDNNPFGFKMPTYDDFWKRIKNVNWGEVEQLYKGVKALFEERHGYQPACSSCNERGKPCPQHSTYEGMDKLKDFFTKVFSKESADVPEPADFVRCIDDLANQAKGLDTNEEQRVYHAKIAVRAYMTLDNMPKKEYEQTRAFLATVAKYHADRAVGKKGDE